MPDVWTPGNAGPHEDLVGRIHSQIRRFASERGIEQAVVELELRDGSRFELDALLPEPGYGFVTIRPHAGDEDVPPELIDPGRADRADRAPRGAGQAVAARLLRSRAGLAAELELVPRGHGRELEQGPLAARVAVAELGDVVVPLDLEQPLLDAVVEPGARGTRACAASRRATRPSTSESRSQWRTR